MRLVGMTVGVVVLISVAAGWTPCQKSPDQRLVEAELLEVASGDLGRAMAVYQALIQDEKAPEAVRARALLYHAPCHRKKGQRRTAEKLLNDLVKNHAKMKDLVRQAKSFLDELRSGKSANPAFDWLGELEKNPEIQARVFQLVMDLAPNNGDRHRASRQLLALGTLAVPMMERLLKTSQDPGHRGAIAVLLVRSGRYEALHVLFESAEALDSGDDELWPFVRQIPGLDEDSRKRLRKVLARIRVDHKGAGILDALRLKMGDTSDLEAKLRRMEVTHQEWGYIYDYEPVNLSLFGVLKSVVSKEGKQALLGRRLQDPKCPDDARDFYLEILLEKTLDHVPLDRLAPLVSALKGNYTIDKYAFAMIRALDARGDHDALAGFMAWPILRKYVLDHFKTRYDPFGKTARFSPDWFQVLLAGNCYKEMHQLAERNDSCVKPFVAFLKNRKQDAPAYLGYGGRDPKWRPTAEYVKAMKDILLVDDPVSQAIALEALALAVPVKGEKVLPELERLILEPRDFNLREFALYALLKRFETRSWTGPEVARILVADFEKYRQNRFPIRGYFESPLRRLRGFGCLFIGVAYMKSGAKLGFKRPDGPADYGPDYGHWVFLHLDRQILIRLTPHIRDLSGMDAGERFFHWLAEHVGVIPMRKILLETLPGIKDLKTGSSVLELKGIEFLKDSSE